MGFILDPETGKKRRVHALIFTAVVSRHMFVWLTYSQTLTAMIAGCETAWGFFGGVFKVLIPDNLKAVVTAADAVNPRLSTGWLDYAQHVGFATDPARVRTPQDKPRVERAVQYVRGNFWAGETFADLEDAQARVTAWCSERAGMRIHGTTAARPAEMFTELEAPCLLAVPAPYDVPVFTRVKVHRDYHVEVARALYSIPEQWIGQHLDARADSDLVKLYSTGSGGGRLVKTHPRQPPGGRSTDRLDLPEHKAGYAMRDLTQLITTCAGHGVNIGIYAERLLDDPLPWTRMRRVYALFRACDRFGDDRVNQACVRAVDAECRDVNVVIRMVERALEAEADRVAAPEAPLGVIASRRGRSGRRSSFPPRRSYSPGSARRNRCSGAARPGTTRISPTRCSVTSSLGFPVRLSATTWRNGCSGRSA